MRSALIFLVAFGFSFGFGQQTPRSSLFLTTRIEATVVVRKHNMGADMVEISILKPTYAHDLLTKQIAQIGTELGMAPRGVMVYDYQLVPQDPNSTVVKATFAVDGLIDRSQGVLRIQPIVRGLSLATSTDELSALMIQFAGESPSPKTLKSCSPADGSCRGAIIEGQSGGTRAMDQAFGIEYRVKILTHDPAQINLSDATPLPKVDPIVPPGRAKIDGVLVALIVLAAASIGALVYSLLLRGRPKSPA